MRLLAAALIALALAAPLRGQTIHETSAGPVEVARVVGGLDTPWSLGFLPGGGLLVTERPGRLLHFSGSGVQAVAGVPAVWANGQGGLFDVVPARDFATTREIFLSYAEPRRGGAGTALAVARLSRDGARLDDLRVIFRMAETSPSTEHFGGRVVERPDGTLFLTLGERGARNAAQDLASHLGKIVRVRRDGSVPRDNPFVGRQGALPEIWSLGHRNVQGAALAPDGGLYAAEHGPRGGDEINRPQAGGNYGWPIQSFGREYVSRRWVGAQRRVRGIEAPLWYWDASPAVSGLAILSGRMFPEWRGDLFTGALQHDAVIRLSGRGAGIVEAERLFDGAYARIRDVREAPDGALWFIAEAEGAIYRAAPARRAPRAAFRPD